ncbi:MAG: DUF1345 domain-containing protein [Geminicoccaceae bacterium]
MKLLPESLASRHLRNALLAAVVAAAIVLLAAWRLFSPEISVALSWDAFVAVLGGWLLFGITRLRERTMLTNVRNRSPSGRMLAVLATAAAAFSIYAIVLLMGATGTAPPELATQHVIIGAVTTVLSWTLVHLLFGLEYARLYYTVPDTDPEGTPQGGLEFPGGQSPTYFDFFYFSFVIGVACQTADVSITSRSLRKVCLAQGLVAFVFNTVILAATINVAAGLVSSG